MILACGIASIAVAPLWLFYGYYIFALDYEGADCDNPDLTSCGDSRTQLYGWGQALVAVAGLAMLFRALVLAFSRGSDQNLVRARKAANTSAALLVVWLLAIATRMLTAGQIY